MKENMWEKFKFIGVRNLSMKSYEKSFFLLEVSIFHKVGESRTPTDIKVDFLNLKFADIKPFAWTALLLMKITTEVWKMNNEQHHW